MKQLTRKEKNVLKTIASFYGCKVKFSKEVNEAYWDGKYITIGIGKTKTRSLSFFCHELGHFLNWKTGKYPVYHNNTGAKLVKKFPSYSKFINYALRAEVFTDKVGKQLMEEWFPEYEYMAAYKNPRIDYAFLYGYFLRS